MSTPIRPEMGSHVAHKPKWQDQIEPEVPILGIIRSEINSGTNLEQAGLEI